MTSREKYSNPDAMGRLGLAYHYEMVADTRRVASFKEAIERTCADRIVLESGTGSAILSLLAAQAGAKMVYTFDIDPSSGEFASANIRRSGYSTIVFKKKNILDVTLADLDDHVPDVVIAENLSTWQVTEPQIQVLNHINSYLVGPGTIRLPSRIFNFLELAESQYRFEGLVDLRTHYFQFSGIRPPVALSARLLFKEVDLSQINATSVRGSVRLPVTGDGILNSLRLTSPLQIYQNIAFESSDSLVPPVIVPLRGDLPVRRGDYVQVDVSFETAANWEGFECSAKRVE